MNMEGGRGVQTRTDYHRLHSLSKFPDHFQAKGAKLSRRNPAGLMIRFVDNYNRYALRSKAIRFDREESNRQVQRPHFLYTAFLLCHGGV